MIGEKQFSNDMSDIVTVCDWYTTIFDALKNFKAAESLYSDRLQEPAFQGCSVEF